jgi:hypothetical protein
MTLYSQQIKDMRRARQKSLDSIVMLFTHEAQDIIENGNPEIAEGIQNMAFMDYAPVDIVFLNGNQSPEGIKAFMQSNFLKKENVIIVMADPENGLLAAAAKEEKIDVAHVSSASNMVRSWQCAVA